MEEALKSCTVHIYFSDRLCCKCGQRDEPHISKYSKSFSFGKFVIEYIYNMLLMNIQKQNCQYLIPSLKAAQMNLRYLIQMIPAAYLQDHLCFPWPSEARAKSSTPSPCPTSNMSKHVKFHFCGIFFIGCDLRWVGALECWRASQDVSIPD